MGGKAFAAVLAFPAATNGRAVLVRAGIDNLAVGVRTEWAFHAGASPDIWAPAKRSTVMPASSIISSAS